MKIKEMLGGIFKVLSLAVVAILFGACIVCLCKGAANGALEFLMTCLGGWR